MCSAAAAAPSKGPVRHLFCWVGIQLVQLQGGQEECALNKWVYVEACQKGVWGWG